MDNYLPSLHVFRPDDLESGMGSPPLAREGRTITTQARLIDHLVQVDDTRVLGVYALGQGLRGGDYTGGQFSGPGSRKASSECLMRLILDPSRADPIGIFHRYARLFNPDLGGEVSLVLWTEAGLRLLKMRSGEPSAPKLLDISDKVYVHGAYPLLNELVFSRLAAGCSLSAIWRFLDGVNEIIALPSDTRLNNRPSHGRVAAELWSTTWSDSADREAESSVQQLYPNLSRYEIGAIAWYLATEIMVAGPVTY